jgi:hypothetical protein
MHVASNLHARPGLREFELGESSNPLKVTLVVRDENTTGFAV